MTHFDYVIIGAGSAGSVLANRLSASGRHSVLVLEAGGTDCRPSVQIPIGYGRTYYDERVNWKYLSEPVQQLNGRTSYWPRGRVLGGSSSINAMVYVRGHTQDFDQWGAAAPGWAWKDLEPLYRRMENWHGEPDERRGRSGPLSVTDITSQAHPLCSTFLDAAAERQLPMTDDYNAGSMEGATLYQITTDRGWRASAAKAYLRPAMRRSNVVVQMHALVQRLLLHGQRVTGVRYLHQGVVKLAMARADVILCAGAVNSPQVLQLSGLGPAAVLSDAGVPVVHDLPAVGEHLSDHLGADLVCRTRVPSLNQALGPWHGKLRAVLQFLLAGKGPLSLSLNQAGGFIRSSPRSAGPDLQLYFSPVSYTRAPPGTRPLISPDPFPGFLLGYNPCKPTSTGTVHITHADAAIPPRIQPNYLDTEHDRQLMLAGMRLIRSLVDTRAMRSVIEAEILPGPATQSNEQMIEFIRNTAWTVFHPCCTCRMGSDPRMSVVDNCLRVHGIRGLRVADASVFPCIPTGNTNAPAMLVGERASDLILADAH
ncbi:MAG: choline dehydrogenase [Granulosicoccus sp.]|nr:choline dehydrogenase [Granulosicoccus sp.]